jgi:hypothetical protein
VSRLKVNAQHMQDGFLPMTTDQKTLENSTSENEATQDNFWLRNS